MSDLPHRIRGSAPYASPAVEIHRIDAVGLSMFPALWPGDQVDIGPSFALSSGDVVAFIGGCGRSLVHRLLGICPRGDRWLTAGDTSGRHDEPVPGAAVIGKVVRVRRRLLGVWVSVPRVFWVRRRVSSYVAQGTLRLAGRLLGFGRRLRLRS
ncbi:MAG: S24/S26 family peptidase [bacterium]